MKRLPFSFAALPLGTLIAILSFAALPKTASAQQCLTQDVQELLEQEPIGHYMEKIIDRANDAIDRAQSTPQGDESGFELVSFQWLVDILSSVLALVDTQTRVVEYERDLSQLTACLHADLALLEAKMEEVRCELDEAFNNRSLGGILRLQSLQRFLNSRYRNLVRGAHDPTFVDTTFDKLYIFDEPRTISCCLSGVQICTEMDSTQCLRGTNQFSEFGEIFDTETQCVESGCRPGGGRDVTEVPREEFEPLCPFDTDYLVPVATGYGCDASVFVRAGFVEENDDGEADLDPDDDDIGTTTEEELKAQIQLEKDLEDFFGDSEAILQATLNVSNLNGTQVDPRIANFGIIAKSDHIRRFDCRGEQKPPPDDDDEPSDEEEDEDEGDDDEEDDDDGPNPWPEGAAAYSVRNPFSAAKDHINLLRSFLNLLVGYEAVREFPDFLKIPGEFTDDAARIRAIRAKQDIGPFSFFLGYFRQNYRSFSEQQSRLDAAILPKVGDPQAQITEILTEANLREEMRKLVSSISSPTSGFRGFVKEYAYYLHRSCITRPCSEKIERMLRILFENTCFPYVSGAYRSSGECTNADQCLQAILDEDELPEDVAERCE